MTGESGSICDLLRLAGEDAGGVIGFILALVGPICVFLIGLKRKNSSMNFAGMKAKSTSR